MNVEESTTENTEDTEDREGAEEKMEDRELMMATGNGAATRQPLIAILYSPSSILSLLSVSSVSSVVQTESACIRVHLRLQKLHGKFSRNRPASG
jgi:hypothetical protein